ncbi:ATP-dependent zinc metalloprotease FTSH 12, chloroplastic [Apostasia shenzhenica]|uniref:ATP-dependent zinc metalloprotease FTSH 12, chloroplastic n=1 Tax=Apostasia shenzhenica TaxID=1088818 RepID=A0A2I0B4Y0_9ASPA|nr:ATP-dependent zinc metalloprotease FTSH 12, chloroplastic [Apostasia shenzhenica]
MEVGIYHFPYSPLVSPPFPLRKSVPLPHFRLLSLVPERRSRTRRVRASFRAMASRNADDLGGFTWESVSRSIKRGSERFRITFVESLKKETGFDPSWARKMVEEMVEAVNKGIDAVGRFRLELLPAFVEWNRWENWKELNKWQLNRIGAFILYAIVLTVSIRQTYIAIRSHAYRQSRNELTEAYMEALIPDPTPANVRRVKKGIWRKTLPKGLIIKKFLKGPGGTYIQDSSYVGEDAWDDDLETSEGTLNDTIDKNASSSQEQKEAIKEKLGILGQDYGTWRERLKMWKDIVRKDKLAEQIDSLTAKYVVDFDMQEVEKSLRNDVVDKASNSQDTRALWISKRWWRYRPKLPYTYFLDKLDSSEVAAVVFSEDLKRVYVTMKEGFPLEYIVDIPLDPYMFEAISSSGAEVDLLQKSQIHYLLKIVIALAPGLIILYLIRESVMLLHVTSGRYLYKRYNQLFDMAYSENFILPVESSEEVKSMYNEVILGGDVWDLLDEIMIYMNNPMQYYEKKVPFVRGLLLSGPPGTGKTLFARTLAKESGLPFVFASGAEFTDNEKSGAARINQLFSIAKRNAPSFVFVDEIDAIAGRHARKDPRRRATFEALLTQLDGEKETTGVDRFSLRQAVVFICATNRPDELDPEFVQAGRIDRRLYIGLPDAKQRVRIFGVHSAGKRIAEDVDFEKLVFRTVGYSGADIRNLVNEAAIMSVRKGHSVVTQQDIIDVLDKQLLEGMGVLLTEEEQQKCETRVSMETKRLLAVHEAGHILLAHLFPRFDWHAFSQLLPGGKETAISVFYPREEIVDQGYTTFGYLKMQMVVAHGGYCAERLVFGDDITDGGRDDLEKITKIAREMVISPRNARLGLTTLVRRVGMLDRPDSADGEVIKYKWDDPSIIPADITIEVSELFTRELTRYIEETKEFALNGLSKNREIFDMIVEELMENSRITGLEVEERMKHMAPVMFEDFIDPFQINLEVEGPLPVNPRLHYQPLDVYPAPLHRC